MHFTCKHKGPIWMHRSPLWCTYVQLALWKTPCDARTCKCQCLFCFSKTSTCITCFEHSDTNLSRFVSLRSKQLLALAHKGPLWASLKKCLFCSCTCTWCTCTYVHQVQVHQYKSSICKCITKFSNFVSLLCTGPLWCTWCTYVQVQLALAHKGPLWCTYLFC